ncbi:MAG: tocopherol cyclase family protein [Chloroflexota bacterium]
MPSYLYTVLHPEIYHGRRAQAPFFEGWYFKLVSADERVKLAVIPGVILGEHGHAFIQVLDGAGGESAYYRFGLDELRAAEQHFELWIGENHFSLTGMQLALDRHPQAQDGLLAPDRRLALHGQVQFGPPAPWPVSLGSPGIMGPYAWAPAMECYHGVLSFDHTLRGRLALDDEAVDFDDGRGYIEKDWGRSFPQAWVWLQSNHFHAPAQAGGPVGGGPGGTCLTGSIAIIPWRGRSFNGFIVGLWHAGQLYRFASYTGAQVERLQIDEQQVRWTLRDRRLRLELTARRSRAGLLLGPEPLEMGKRVLESLSAQVEVRLSRLDGRVIFEGSGRHAGLEVYDAQRLV